jgi:adenosylcobinamide kinase/adenosylcobinamide-phosphate guanylyltransferase
VITLVLGGARSGKSALAERLADQWAEGAPVSYVATGDPVDPDMAERIDHHRARRPAHWLTIEAGGDLTGPLLALRGVVLIDAIGTWLARTDNFEFDSDGLLAALASRVGDTVVVSEEVGLGVHPETAVGRIFRDVLGRLNQDLASISDEVLFVVAGRAMRLERLG